MQPRVRDDEPVRVDLLVAVQQQVEVDPAGPEARTVAGAPERILDGVQAREQVVGRKCRGDRRDRVQKRRLVGVADRLGLVERRRRDDVDAGLAIEDRERGLQQRCPVAEVRPESDVRLYKRCRDEFAPRSVSIGDARQAEPRRAECRRRTRRLTAIAR